ncbi:PTS system N-acetylglucosamine-specific IIB component [Kineosphaera limosa]|uniref:Putative phosphotransferase system enzyme IIB component n=1 Tax=Kineosphaera limosa NBRC 100340 TaxID=1184609 RepID=K6W4T3_9MICO|nr:PTS glucose/sucrose transporter subunit IIB [Kineosphaera limosa]NYE02315.1 PTS system N-acetylglucosamine-specific IIB component [Kineosphaera limosa]GAB94170.1 putative phosphotransferase system enzyme IIB component [Kineosphaera limosa NBRC 100340]
MSKASDILAALGGSENIVEIEPCTTRLRTELSDPGIVDERKLKQAGAHGVITAGNVVQIVVGLNAENLADEIEGLR